jgi:hypothetical protein
MGVDFRDLSAAITQITQKLSEAGAGGDELRKRLADLGVEVYDANGRFRSTSDIMQDLLPALAAIPQAQDRANLSLAIFGRGWAEIAPMISQGELAIKKFKEESPAISAQDMKDIDEFRIKWEKFGSTLDIIKVKIGLVLIDMVSANQDLARGMTAQGPSPLDSIGIMAAKYGALPQGPGPSPTETFKDEYAGLTDIQLALRAAEDDVVKFHLAMKSDTTQEQFDKDAAAARKAELAVARIKDEMNNLTVAATTAAKATTALWAPTSVVGTEGSEMQLFLQREMELGTSYQDALNKWSTGDATRSGPQEGTLGAVGGSSEKKAVSPAAQSAIDTKSLTVEFDKQAGLYTSLNEKIASGWMDLEKKGLIHYTALSELSRVRAEAELGFMTACVNFGGENPIIQNKIIMSADGPDWTPATFTPLKAPSLEAADFSGIKFLTGGSGKSEKAGAAGAGGVKVEQNFYGDTDAEKVKVATVDGINQALGEQADLIGAGG